MKKNVDGNQMRGYPLRVTESDASNQPDHQMKPIMLTLTKHTATCELCEMAHPNQIEAVGTLQELGKRGLRLIVRFKGQTWQVKKANNTDFFKGADKVKAAAGIPWKHAEGERWLDDAGRILISEKMWKQVP